ncbi:MAG: DUF1249 domain-containing protein [Methylococcales bacterium]|nr:DUF1249 domain-containing protein [Methylococcales bacterium]
MSLLHPVNTSHCLEKLCESNFQKLFCLIPDLCSFQYHATGKTTNKPALHLKIIDRSKHTLTVELSHRFNKNLEHQMAPAVKIRIYLDANLAEVLKDHARTDVSKIYRDPGQTVEIMNYKWRLNYFLQKWLDHCLQTDYEFRSTGMC